MVDEMSELLQLHGTPDDRHGRERGGDAARCDAVCEADVHRAIDWLSDRVPDAIARHDRATRVVCCNAGWTALFAPARDATGCRVDALAPVQPFALRYQRALDRVLATGKAEEFDVAHDTAQGRRDIRFRIVPDGGAGCLTVFGRDVTREKELEDDLARHSAAFQEVVEHSPDHIARYDRDGRRVYANAAMTAALGGDPARILGRTPLESPAGPWGRQVMRTLRDVVARGEAREVDVRLQAGGDVCHRVRLIPQFDRSGAVSHVLGIGKDISEIDRYRRKAEHQSLHDGLTGLPNRESVTGRLARMIADAGLLDAQCAVVLLDLDHFKNVNDILGHHTGNALLCATARRLQECVRDQDTVARLGGDEFALLLPGVRGAQDVAALADKVLRRLVEPFVIAGRELFVTASIGIALSPGDGTDPDTLLKFADSAMYHAKKAGRNNVQFYARELTVRSLERMDLELALRKARRNGELDVYYQPQVDLETGHPIGAEALLRWHRPGHGVVGPDRFIAIAEEAGLIVDIGEWVLRTACRSVVRWNAGRATPLTVAVNLSPRQFVRNDLVGTVLHVLAETGCRPEWLELEITEGLLLEDCEETMTILAALTAMNIAILIDDFGTGYSALSYLHRFPVSHLKIDRSFIRGIDDQADKRELIRAMLLIASALDLGSVAEGVETAEQAGCLRAWGCRAAQGYLFGKPMPAAQFDAYLSNPGPEHFITNGDDTT
jgi:diguanylate cyclase (GGDEF)-like protein/PAS domain S-box-containing protein